MFSIYKGCVLLVLKNTQCYQLFFAIGRVLKQQTDCIFNTFYTIPAMGYLKNVNFYSNNKFNS